MSSLSASIRFFLYEALFNFANAAFLYYLLDKAR